MLQTSQRPSYPSSRILCISWPIAQSTWGWLTTQSQEHFIISANPHLRTLLPHIRPGHHCNQTPLLYNIILHICKNIKDTLTPIQDAEVVIVCFTSEKSPRDREGVSIPSIRSLVPRSRFRIAQSGHGRSHSSDATQLKQNHTEHLYETVMRSEVAKHCGARLLTAEEYMRLYCYHMIMELKLLISSFLPSRQPIQATGLSQ